ncbi:MAG: tyrosine-type recombinase/integrase [Candidatus Competibacteraceae bacterium]|nr:tyrosine-type recombinase/integrase [Candidatus Competibacteraceae bacterium]
MKQDLDLRYWQMRYREYMDLVRGWSQRTVDTYSQELKPFFHFLECQGLTQLGRLKRSHLEGYRLELSQAQSKGKPLAASTQRGRLSGVKQFVKFLYRENYLLVDLAGGFEIPGSPRALPRVVLSETEVLRLIEFPNTQQPEGLRDRALLELLYGTGIRNTELRELRLGQVDLGQGVLRVEHGKGGKARVLPLGEEAQAWLEEYLHKARPLWALFPEEDRVFVGEQGRPLTRRWLAHQVRRLALRAGLKRRPRRMYCAIVVQPTCCAVVRASAICKACWGTSA